MAALALPPELGVSRWNRSGSTAIALLEEVVDRFALFQQADALRILELAELCALVRRQDFVDIHLHAIEGKVRLAAQDANYGGVFNDNLVRRFALLAVEIELVKHLASPLMGPSGTTMDCCCSWLFLCHRA